MQSQNKKVFFADNVFHVSEHVYVPAEDSFLFAENLRVNEGNNVLDMGTGCGILGIVAAEKASEVIAIDVNPYAVRCARENARVNGVSAKFFFVQGDMFSTLRIGQKFDLILFNAPYLPLAELQDGSWLERAWFGGTFGRQLIDCFINEAPKYLKRDGRCFLMQSTLSSVDETLRQFKENGLEATIVAERDLPFFETIVLFEARH